MFSRLTFEQHGERRSSNGPRIAHNPTGNVRHVWGRRRLIRLYSEMEDARAESASKSGLPIALTIHVVIF